MPHIALIDADSLIWKAGKGAENQENPHVSVSLHNLRSLMTQSLQAVLDNFTMKDYEVFIGDTDQSCFRYKVAKTLPYKGNRTGNTPPIHLHEMRQVLIEEYGAKVSFGEEADDAVGKRARQLGDKAVIVSNDKDLRMIGDCWHIEPNRKPFYTDQLGFLMLEKIAPKTKLSKDGKKKYATIDLFGAGEKWFYAQCLLGDRADNIPGIKFIKKKEVFDALQPCKSIAALIAAVHKIYEENNVSLEQLTEVETLLWIRR